MEKLSGFCRALQTKLVPEEGVKGAWLWCIHDDIWKTSRKSKGKSIFGGGGSVSVRRSVGVQEYSSVPLLLICRFGE